MPKCTVFIATSLDGFIARKNGDLDWLPGSDGEETSNSNEDYGYQKLFDSIDTLVFGRKTYEFVKDFEPWPYAGKTVVVLSSQYSETLEPLREDVYGTSLQPKPLVAQLEANGTKHIYVDGGKTIQSFLNANLINELIITRIPVLIGEGIPLFGPLHQDIQLKHISTTAYDSNFVQSTYHYNFAQN